MTPYSPKFVTETAERPPWRNCTWASGLQMVNKAMHGKVPATTAEYQALRNASGDHFGGSNLTNLHDGILRRYGWTLRLEQFNELRDILHAMVDPAMLYGFVAQGLYANLPSHFQRWDRAFAAKGPDSGHATYVQGHDRGGNFHITNGIVTDVFWNDPLGRSPAGTPAAKQYRGEWMPVGAFAHFIFGPDYCAGAAQDSHRA